MAMPLQTLVKENQSTQSKTDFDAARSRLKHPLLGAAARVAAVVVLLAGLAPFVFICWLIAATGANNICIDYAAFIHVVDKVLSGQYQWLSLFSDSFIRTHMVLFPVLVHTAIAYATHWDVTFELYVGMVFHAIRALLIADLIVGRSSNRWSRYAITGVVASLVFAMSQTCIMIYGEASIAIGLCLLGFTFALWALCKFGRTPHSLLLMFAGGVVSSYSFGNVVPCWATLLLAIILLPARGWTQRWNPARTVEVQTAEGKRADSGNLFVNRKVAFAYWLVGTVVSLAPYYHFLSRRSVGSPELTKTFGLFDPSFLINALGRPFAKDMGLVYGKLQSAEIASWILLGLVVALAVPTLIYRLKLSNLGKTCLLLFAYGFISVWIVGVFRVHVAPWYASMAMYCWLAVFGMSVANLTKAFKSDVDSASLLSKTSRITLIATSVIALGTILVLYLTSNLSYRDKQFFLTARAPVSAEYLRSYKTAPTFLESSVFSADGRPERILSFANSLAKHNLCVFSPNQVHALQGQFALSNVSIQSVPGSKRVMWLEGRNTRRKASWRDYNHLNLDVPDGNIVDWRFTIPADANEAVFETSVSSFSDPAGSCTKAFAKVVSTITVVSTTAPPPVPGSDQITERVPSSGSASYVTFCDQSWKPVRLNLLPYRGKTVTLRLASQSQGDLYSGMCDDRDCIPSSVLYMYPHINLVLNEKEQHDIAQEIRPSNTDLSAEFPRNYMHQLDLPAFDSKAWTNVPLGLPQDKSAALQMKHWDLPEQKRLSIDDFDYLVFQMQPLPGKHWCSIKMHLQFDDGTTDGISIPLLADKKNHRYSYPAKLLTPKSGARLVGMLVYASALDEKTSAKQTNLVEKFDDDEPAGAPLCNCIHVSSIACVRAFPN